MSKGKYKHKPQSRCKGYRRYQGLKVPRCHGGRGCYGCWSKYFARKEENWE